MERRYSSARSEARRADKAVREASRRELDRLLELPLDKRFSALEQPGLELTAEDRRTLLRSLKEKGSAKRAIMAKTASPWSIFRAQLPYKIVSLTASTAFILISGALLMLARVQTPERWVVSAYDQDIAATWRFADGQLAGEGLEARRHYLLYKRTGAEGVLRVWVSATGYAEARVSLQWLRALN